MDRFPVHGWEYTTSRVQHISNPGNIISRKIFIESISLYHCSLFCWFAQHGNTCVLGLKLLTRIQEFASSFLYTNHASNWLLSPHLPHSSRIPGVYIMWQAVEIRRGISIRKFAHGSALHAKTASGRHTTTPSSLLYGFHAYSYYCAWPQIISSSIKSGYMLLSKMPEI